MARHQLPSLCVLAIAAIFTSDVTALQQPARQTRTSFQAFNREVHVWEDVFNRSDLNRLAIEARKLSSWALDGDGLVQGKRATCWMDAAGGAVDSSSSGKLLIEQYVKVLARLVAAAHNIPPSPDTNTNANSNADAAEHWLGYEYWVQRVSAKETPAFHYDKDEAMSSHNRKFVYPDVSSIFYLTYDHLALMI